MTKQPVCKVKDIALGKMKTFKVNGKTVLVYHLKEGFFATQSNCTHTAGSLKWGKIVQDCWIQCPIHRARFDIRTGEVVEWANFPPGIQLLNIIRREKALKTYSVTVRGGNVFVEI